MNRENQFFVLIFILRVVSFKRWRNVKPWSILVFSYNVSQAVLETCLQLFISSTLPHFLHHGPTLSSRHVILHSTYPPTCPATSTSPLPPPPPCTAWGGVGVRTCRLPLIWVSTIQFSGCCKPGNVTLHHHHLPPFPLTYPGHKMCRQPPHGAEGTKTRTAPTL